VTIGAYEEALKNYSLAIKATEDLLSKDPDNEFYHSSLQMNLNAIGTLGNLFYNTGRFIQAKNCYELNLSISQKLLETDPENVAYQSHVGTTLNNLGILLSDMGRIDDAKERYEKALEMYEKLLETDPENVVYQSNVGTTLNNLGNLLLDMGRIEEAKERYEESLTIYTEPMQYLTIGKKSHSIIKLIGLNSEQAGNDSNFLNKTTFLKGAIKLCKEYRDFFIKYELKHERKLVTEAGLSTYIDLSTIKVRFETDSRKRAEEYEKALQAVEKLAEIEDDEAVSKLCYSAACYLRGRKLVNEALTFKKPELGLLKQAVEQFKNAKETYEKANVCFCIYIGLLNILEEIEEFEEVNIPKLKELIQKVVKNLPEDVNLSIRVSFENIPQIFEEKDTVTQKELLKELYEKVGEIEYKALENLFGHVHDKIKDYFEEPFSPNVIYENWKLKVLFDDAKKVKGKLTVKACNKTLLNRTLTPEEIKNNLLEIDYLDKKHIPKGEEEISFITLGQKKPVIRQIDYFETINRDKKTRIFIHDVSDTVFSKNVRIAAVQLKYHVYEENSIVKITADDAYKRKVMAILETVKTETDIVVFPEFSIPLDYLDKIQKYADENGIIVVAGSHYVSRKYLGEYGTLFSREFGEADFRKNISPIIIPSSKIVHNEKFLGAREERPVFFDKGMEIGKINNILRLHEKLNVGVMICYEFLNSEFRHRLLPVCDIILVPQTNPKPQSFYKEAENEINRPLGGGTKAFVMANGIFTVEKDKNVTGGSTGVYLTLDEDSNEKKNDGIIAPVDDVMEQFVLIASINTDFHPAWDTQTGQEPIVLKLIHIFEEAEIFSKSKEKGKEFIEFIKKINSCDESDKLRSLLVRERGSIDKKEDEVETSLIKQFSPLMNKRIQDLDELKLEELKENCRCLLIPQN